jgi:hypothetical protein
MRLLGYDSPGEVYNHPRHQAAQQCLADLIAQLRQCSSIAEGHALQQALLGEVLTAETDRRAFARAVRRVRAGKQPQQGVPDPQSGQDPTLPETWQLEHDVCERVARQLRCVGDALAWRVYGYQRKHIIALCQNQSPGPIAGKQGLRAELDRVEQARADGQFALLHDLTNCLRIGDVTVFGGDGTPSVIEIKTDPSRRRPAQNRRIKAAIEAVKNGGPLPGLDRRARLYDLDLPYQNHLKVLRDGAARAAADGIFTAKLPGDRALLVTDIFGFSARGWTEDDWPKAVERKFRARLRSAGIGDDRRWHVSQISLDSVSRDPMRVPFAAYPLAPVTCARIIGDYTVFQVETSGPALAQSLCRAGLAAQWVVPPAQAPTELQPGQVVMNITAKAVALAPAGLARAPGRRGVTMELSQTLQMCRSELDRYLIELLDQDTWIEGIRYLLADRHVDGRPWPHYRGEDQVWL